MNTVKKISISVPVELADDLNYVHRRIGVSKSAFVSALLADGVRDLRVLLEDLPDDPSPEDIVRFRGESARLAQDRISHYQTKLED